METITTTNVIKQLRLKNRSLLTLDDFQRLFPPCNKQTLYKRIQRLEANEIIKTLVKGKYRFTFASINDFAIANFICQPSYISLESALSFYSVITGFAYQITSITPRKTKSVTADNKNFQYSQIAPSLFFGFEKHDDYLIADREKALLDYIYFGFKGLRILNFDEFNLSEMNKTKLVYYAKKFDNKKIIRIIRKFLL